MCPLSFHLFWLYGGDTLLIILHKTLYEGTEVRVSPLPVLKKSVAMLGEGHVAMNSGQPLGAENGPKLTTSRKRGPQSYNYKELNSTKNFRN